MSWREDKLGNVVTLKRGHDLPESVRKDGQIPVVSSSGITGFHNVAKAEPPGVVTGRYGTLGEVFYVDQPYWPLNTALYAIDFHGNNPRFVAYFLKLALRGTKSDKAAVPGVNRNDLHERKVLVPDPVDQERIVAVLQAYDDLIENNRRRIKLLEETARLIYREWFVRLRFPGHEHAKIENGVPEGWERKLVSDCVSYLNRGITPTYDEDAKGTVINQKCIRGGLLDMGPSRHQNKQVLREKLVLNGDVLINSTGEGTLGRVAQVLEELEDCTVDSHVTIARPSESVGSTWFGVSMILLEPKIQTLGRGATNQTELSKSDIGNLPLVLPSEPVRDEFEDQVSPIRKQVTGLIAMNKKLQQARDLLLPRLMSGEIEV